MKKMYDLYETYVGLYVYGSEIEGMQGEVALHFSFVSEYSQPVAYSYEDNTFNVRKFLETFVGNAYQPCLGVGDVPDTFYRFYPNFDDEVIYISGTRNEFTIPFANLDIDSSVTKSIVDRSTITEDF